MKLIENLPYRPVRSSEFGFWKEWPFFGCVTRVIECNWMFIGFFLLLVFLHVHWYTTKEEYARLLRSFRTFWSSLIPIDLVGDTLTRLISYSSISGNRTRKPDFPRNGSSSAMRWAAGGNLARLEITNTSRSSAITCSATACLAISSSATTCSRYSCENRTRVHKSEFVRMQWRMELVRPSAIAYCGAAVTKDCEFANFVARTEF